MLEGLNDRERRALRQFIEGAARRLGTNLIHVSVFGSVARDEQWPDDMPMRSDIDLLIVTEVPINTSTEEDILNSTYELFLFCGRQIAPQFRTRHWLRQPSSEKSALFIEHLVEDAVHVYGEKLF